MIDLDKARAELREKKKADIDAETADVWAARAIAAFELGFAKPCTAESIRWLMDAEGYEVEAKEHAAGCGAKKLLQIEAVLKEAKKRLWEAR
jgi:hypothetical protein